eukprot:scaffold52740_cov67-Phaeocystis_antarctica.AAC.2
MLQLRTPPARGGYTHSLSPSRPPNITLNTQSRAQQTHSRSRSLRAHPHRADPPSVMPRAARLGRRSWRRPPPGKRYSSGLRFGQQFRQMEARLARNRAFGRPRAPSILAPLERRATLGVSCVRGHQQTGAG